MLAGPAVFSLQLNTNAVSEHCWSAPLKKSSSNLINPKKVISGFEQPKNSVGSTGPRPSGVKSSGFPSHTWVCVPAVVPVLGHSSRASPSSSILMFCRSSTSRVIALALGSPFLEGCHWPDWLPGSPLDQLWPEEAAHS